MTNLVHDPKIDFKRASCYQWYETLDTYIYKSGLNPSQVTVESWFFELWNLWRFKLAETRQLVEVGIVYTYTYCIEIYIEYSDRSHNVMKLYFLLIYNVKNVQRLAWR